jgi:ABC-type branched-subunit amino acid transport system substrate-binding protein
MLIKIIKNVFLFLILITVFSGCFPIFSNLSFAEEKSIKIGVLTPLTGPFAYFGSNWMQGIQKSAMEINSRGGWKGIPLKLLIINIDYEPEAAYSAAQRLIYNESIKFILGPLTIGDALTVSKLANITKTIHITPVTSSQIFSSNLGYTFKVGPTDLDISKVSAVYVSDISKHKRVAFITSDIPYLKNMTHLQEQFFPRHGLNVVFEEVVQFDQNDFYQTLTKIKNSKADILYANLNPRLGIVLKQIHEINLNVQTIDSAILTPYKDVFGIAGPKIAGHLSIGHLDYEKLGYDSLYLIYDALKKTGTPEVEEIRKAMVAEKGGAGFYDWGGPRQVAIDVVKFTAMGTKKLIKDFVLDVPPDPPWSKD